MAYSVDELTVFAEEAGFDDARKLKALRGYLESMQEADDDTVRLRFDSDLEVEIRSKKCYPS